MELLQYLITNKLTVRDGIVLIRLSIAHRAYPSDITCDLITAACLSQILDKLLSKGLITRENDTKDKRRSILRTTKAGREVLSH